MAKTLKELAKAFNALDIGKNGCFVSKVYEFIYELYDYLRSVAKREDENELIVPKGKKIAEVSYNLMDSVGHSGITEYDEDNHDYQMYKDQVKYVGRWLQNIISQYINCKTPLYKTLEVISKGLQKVTFADEEVLDHYIVICQNFGYELEKLNGSKKLRLKKAYEEAKKAYEEYQEVTEKEGLAIINKYFDHKCIDFGFCKAVSNDRNKVLTLQKLLHKGVNKRSDCIAIANLLVKDCELRRLFEELSKVLS